MAWFKRDKQGITTSTEEKLEVPDGVWWQCSSCKKTIPTGEKMIEIIEGKSHFDLTNLVMEKISRGWIPLGAPFTTHLPYNSLSGLVWYQAMTFTPQSNPMAFGPG